MGKARSERKKKEEQPKTSDEIESSEPQNLQEIISETSELETAIVEESSFDEMREEESPEVEKLQPQEVLPETITVAINPASEVKPPEPTESNKPPLETILVDSEPKPPKVELQKEIIKDPKPDTVILEQSTDAMPALPPEDIPVKKMALDVTRAEHKKQIFEHSVDTVDSIIFLAPPPLAESVLEIKNEQPAEIPTDTQINAALKQEAATKPQEGLIIADKALHEPIFIRDTQIEAQDTSDVELLNLSYLVKPEAESEEVGIILIIQDEEKIILAAPPEEKVKGEVEVQEVNPINTEEELLQAIAYISELHVEELDEEMEMEEDFEDEEELQKEIIIILSEKMFAMLEDFESENVLDPIDQESSPSLDELSTENEEEAEEKTVTFLVAGENPRHMIIGFTKLQDIQNFFEGKRESREEENIQTLESPITGEKKPEEKTIITVERFVKLAETIVDTPAETQEEVRQPEPSLDVSKDVMIAIRLALAQGEKTEAIVDNLVSASNEPENKIKRKKSLLITIRSGEEKIVLDIKKFKELTIALKRDIEDPIDFTLFEQAPEEIKRDVTQNQFNVSLTFYFIYQALLFLLSLEAPSTASS